MLPATVIVPTRRRAAYLEVALASLAPQVAAAGCEVVVVDDGDDPATRDVAARLGARVVPAPPPGGINAARNAGADAARGALLCLLDDDVRAAPGWLAALLEADAREPEDVGVLCGPVRAVFEGHRLLSCGRERPPITTLDLGPADADADVAWGSNMAVRAAAFARVGRFDEAIGGSGDEVEWQARLRAAGGRVRYVAAAAVEHRRAGDDARLRSLARAAYARGRPARREDVREGRAPSVAREVRVLAGSLAHVVRFACPNGLVLAAQAAGRLREALDPQPQGGEDFLSGRSGTVGGRRDALRAVADAALDLEALPRVRALDRAARVLPARRTVLVVGVAREGRRMPEVLAELRRSRHTVVDRTVPMGAGGKFEHLRAALGGEDLAAVDWLLAVDDDVVLPRGFLDRFVLCCEDAGLRLAQPAHRRRSHASWPVTRRRAGQAVRRTRFVEIGPVTALHRDTFGVLLPFPELRMGWGLDLHWGAVAQRHGWPLGVVDATPVRHLAPSGSASGHADPIAEARAFLAGRPYVRRAQAGWSEAVPAP